MRSTFRFVVLLLPGLVALPTTSAAQATGPTWSSYRARYSVADEAPSEYTAHFAGSAPDHRYEGLVIGAVVLGATGALLSTVGDSDSGAQASPVLWGSWVPRVVPWQDCL